MRYETEAKDATKPLSVIYKPRHFVHCKRKDPEHCGGANGIMSIPGVKWCRVFLELTYVEWENGNITRYQNDATMQRIAELNDLGGRRSLIQEFRDEFKEYGNSIKATLLPPRWNIRLTTLRSDEFKKARKASAVKRAKEIANGSPKRKYNNPSNRGLRNGSGRSHSLPGYPRA